LPSGAISQIFSNLIINSIMHGFKDIERGEITILVKLYGEHVHITYKDNGYGLSDKQLTHLFDPFILPLEIEAAQA
jgi:signal transduction histidine kinase